eukprot:12405539-Karenia_brevis.AAC.1
MRVSGRSKPLYPTGNGTTGWSNDDMYAVCGRSHPQNVSYEQLEQLLCTAFMRAGKVGCHNESME